MSVLLGHADCYLTVVPLEQLFVFIQIYLFKFIIVIFLIIIVCLCKFLHENLVYKNNLYTDGSCLERQVTASKLSDVSITGKTVLFKLSTTSLTKNYKKTLQYYMTISNYIYILKDSPLAGGFADRKIISKHLQDSCNFGSCRGIWLHGVITELYAYYITPFDV